MTLDKARKVKMVLKTAGGETIVLKPEVTLDDGDVIDSHVHEHARRCATSTSSRSRTPTRPA